MKAILGAISRFLQFVGRSVLALTGWTTIVLVIVVIVPASYYVWRAHQPLSMPEYNGLTYNQFTEWRMMICEKNMELMEKKECPPRYAHVVMDILATGIPFVILAGNNNLEVITSIPPAEFLPRLWDSFESNMWLLNKQWLRSVRAQVPSPEQFAEMQLTQLP
jgi:hypothetical protein